MYIQHQTRGEAEEVDEVVDEAAEVRETDEGRSAEADKATQVKEGKSGGGKSSPRQSVMGSNVFNV